jgi:hypothetical protein
MRIARTTWECAVAEAAARPEYANYAAVRERVFQMLDESSRASGASPSSYWTEELEGFAYLLDASPIMVSTLRKHCYHITGLHDYEYRAHHAPRRPGFEAKLGALRAVDRSGLFVPESPALGGFGHLIDGELVNIDTLKYYECLIALDKACVLASLQRPGGPRPIVWEIGGGWGGFAHVMKTRIPRVCYVIVDLPQTLLLSATYLKSVFTKARAFMYGDFPLEQLSNRLEEFDFVFLPHYRLPELDLPYLDLVINTVSFQEMTSAQVGAYVDKAKQLKAQAIYSLNRERSHYNTQIASVTAILASQFQLESIAVLEVPYTDVRLRPRPRTLIRALRTVRGLAPGGRRVERDDNQYRHLIGRPR